MVKQTWDNVLVYRSGRRSPNTIIKYYLKWRKIQTPALQLRGDIPECHFHTNQLIWNGKEIKSILDHINGANGNKRPNNLRLLCPNCHSQQLTHGAGNKGKTEQYDGGFATKDSGNKRNYVLPAETEMLTLIGQNVKLSISK